ncbi:hypothetical protein [Paraburkholderia tagetis]|uniref:Uncharacterized protein n=1 Tax=Paraburkholderia tagetis TaxID=2913261 RepID=A0A9X1RG32_9BURK|nr:hypothetical protein [Paraburkholderia tagetis]MCG5072256.1 hypothetical protein [Paraburkholderia tagetis]
MRNDWLMPEITLLRENYATARSCEELMALFPRHTPNSVRRMAQKERLSRPFAGVVKFRPGRDRLLKLLEKYGSLTTEQIADHLDLTHRGAANIVREYRVDLRVVGWVPPPQKGKWAARFAIANGLPDVPKPFAPKGTRSGGGRRANPFAAAAGLVTVPTGQPGRIYEQDMTGESLQGRSRKLTEAA